MYAWNELKKNAAQAPIRNSSMNVFMNDGDSITAMPIINMPVPLAVSSFLQFLSVKTMPAIKLAGT